MIYFVCKKRHAQGLIETIIAIGIIITGVVSSTSLMVQNQISSEDAQKRLVAVNLAREGLEIVRNMRDTNWLSCEISQGILNCNNWDQGISFGSDTTAVPVFNALDNSWLIDFTADSIHHDDARIWRRNSGDPAAIGAQFNSDQQTPDDSVLTNYRRILELKSICSDKTIADECSGGLTKIGIRVQSKVSWLDRGKESEIVIEERLFNWR